MDYPGNTHKARDAASPPLEPVPDLKKPEKLQPVVTGNVVRQKKSLGRRFKETFVNGDARSVWGYVVLDVLVPAAKDMAADAVTQAIERMLFGEVRSTSRRSGYRPGGPNGYVSYNRYSSPSSFGARRDEERSISRRGRATHNFDEIILETRREAQDVIDKLFDTVARYESASVADLYDLLGVSSSYTDDKWGWTDIRGVGITRVRNGYLLDLPQPGPLD